MASKSLDASYQKLPPRKHGSIYLQATAVMQGFGTPHSTTHARFGSEGYLVPIQLTFFTQPAGTRGCLGRIGMSQPKAHLPNLAMIS